MDDVGSIPYVRKEREDHGVNPWNDVRETLDVRECSFPKSITEQDRFYFY